MKMLFSSLFHILAQMRAEGPVAHSPTDCWWIIIRFRTRGPCASFRLYVRNAYIHGAKCHYHRSTYMYVFILYILRPSRYT